MIVKTLYKDGSFKMADNVDDIRVNEPVKHDTMEELINDVFGGQVPGFPRTENWFDENEQTPVAYTMNMTQSSASAPHGSSMRIVACNSVSYICNDEGKTIETVRPPVGAMISREEHVARTRRIMGETKASCEFDSKDTKKDE